MLRNDDEPQSLSTEAAGDHLRFVVEIDRSTPPVGLLRSGNAEFPFRGWMELLASIESALAEGV